MVKVSVCYQVWDSLHNYKHRTEVSSVDEGVSLATDWITDIAKHRLKVPKLMVVEVTREVTSTAQYGWLGETIKSRPVKSVTLRDGSIIVEDKMEWLS